MTARKAGVFFAGLLMAVAGLSEAAQPDGGYISDWLVAGPIDNGVSLDVVLGYAGGARAKHREGEPLVGCEGRWTRYSGEGNVINLREIAGYAESMTAVAYCEFESDADKAGHIHFATDNEFHLWLNGDLVLERPGGDDESLTPGVSDVALRRGSNSCLMIAKTESAWLFGFTFRVDGPEPTPAPPLIWNPLTPGVFGVENGRYPLFSPDWKWRLGDDPAWAEPGFDDGDWESVPLAGQHGLKAGTKYWIRIHAHFATSSTLVPYSFHVDHSHHSQAYMDGLRVYGEGNLGIKLNPFYDNYQTFRLPRDCVLAVRGVSEGPDVHLARLAAVRADKTLGKALKFFQPQRYHRFFLMICFASYLLYYMLAYKNHPRQGERFWYCVVLFLGFLAIFVLDLDNWTDRFTTITFAWLSQALAGMAVVSGIAMSHVIARGSANKRIACGYGLVGVALYVFGWMANARWIAFIIFPLATLEYVRVWIVYEVIPRRANRRYNGVGVFLFIAGQLFTAYHMIVIGTYFTGFAPYAHLYGFVGLMGSLMIYMSRESALAMRELQSLTATLENRVAERTQQVQQLTQQVITAEEAERERLARELHDSVAQTLWFAKMAAERQLNTVSDDSQTHEMIELLDKAIQEVRGIAYGLRPPELDKLGFVQAISQLCKDFSYSAGVFLDYKAHGVDNICLSSVTEVNLYRVLQEALNNVQQHAEASNVRVRLVGAFPSVILRVEDNGRGFDMVRQRRENAAEAVGHMGLNSMEERIRLVGGTMSIRSAPGEGVRIVFEIPQPKEQV